MSARIEQRDACCRGVVNGGGGEVGGDEVSRVAGAWCTLPQPREILLSHSDDQSNIGEPGRLNKATSQSGRQQGWAVWTLWEVEKRRMRVP